MQIEPQSRVRRRATIKDVARAADVSTVTVSRVVNTPDLVQPRTRARVQEAMRALGYVPNLAAQAMRTNLTRSIGFLTPDLTNYPNAAVAQAAEAVLAGEGYTMLVTNSDYAVERELHALEVLLSRQVDGIILYVCDEEDQRLRQAVSALATPLVVLDRNLPVAADQVLSDHETAMRELVDHLVGQGHRRLLLLQTPLRVRPNLARQRTFHAAAAAHGLGDGARTLHLLPEPPSSLEAVLAALRSAEAPTAIIADGSRLLRLAIRAARLLALGIPDDLSLAGVDAADVATAATPEITTIFRDFAAIGRAAADLILGRLKGESDDRSPQQLMLASCLHHRSSCAPPSTRR